MSGRAIWQWWHVDVAAVAACAAMTGAMYLAVVRPLSARRLERAVLESKLEAMNEIATLIGNSQRRLTTDLTAAQAEIDRAIVLEPVEQLNRRLAGIVDLATTAGLEIDETRSGEVVSSRWFDRVPLSLSGRGHYSECARFLHRLSQEFPDVAVLSFELTGNPGRVQSAAQYRVDLAWYAAAAVASVP